MISYQPLPDDDPIDLDIPARWVKIEDYPDSGARIRGATIYRTTLPSPLAYRVVLTSETTIYRVPIALYRPSMFPTARVQYGFKLPWEPKVLGWHDELPPIATPVQCGSPDYVLYNLREPSP